MGVLSVRRRDGTTVDPRAWRTRKTRHLLRILAMNAGTSVPTERLLDVLWPTVDPAKGRGSLRTAASQIRKVIGRDCVARQFDGLALENVWVDAVAFASSAADARRLLDRAELDRGLDVAQEAAALYTGDLCADEPYADWALVDRERLRNLRVALLAEAADAALELDRLRAAIRLADQVVECEPAAERACRVLMRAHFALGETSGALRSYEQCRQALAAELGAAPSQETRGLHVALLSTAPGGSARVAYRAQPRALRRSGRG